MTVYVADFETTVPDFDEDAIGDISTRVWAWGICEIDTPNSFLYGTTIESFIEWCSKHHYTRDVYFHNLKFDGKFIIDYLLKNGFVYDEEKKKDRSFSCLIAEFGQFYNIEIVFKSYAKRKKSVRFYDSSKKLPLSVADIAKSFKLDIRKGDIDYKKERPEGYEPDENELAYLKNDVEIIGQALSIQLKQGLGRMTIGSDALFNYKTMVGKKYNEWFPDIYDDNAIMYQNLKMFYRGGFTYVNKKFKGVDIGEGITYDVNSLYPSVMKNELLPYGQPIFYRGKYDETFKDIYPLYLQGITCEFRLKEGHIPMVNDRTGFTLRSIEYMEVNEDEPIPLNLTNFELELFFEHYDVWNLEYHGGYMFKGRYGMFDTYIDHWMNVKEQADKDGNKGLRQIAKLMLNSLYGKFGKNIFVGGKYPELDEEEKVIKYYNKPVDLVKGMYMPIAIFITAYARQNMITSAQKCYDRFVYCDTDSLHLIGTDPPENLEIDPYTLGAWKDEGSFIRARFLRAKAYVQEKYNDDQELELLVKCSGMSNSIKDQVTFDNFRFGFTAHGKLVPRTVNGGVVLYDTSYTLKE